MAEENDIISSTLLRRFLYVGNTQAALAAENKEASVSPRTKMIKQKIYYK